MESSPRNCRSCLCRDRSIHDPSMQKSNVLGAKIARSAIGMSLSRLTTGSKSSTKPKTIVHFQAYSLRNNFPREQEHVRITKQRRTSLSSTQPRFPIFLIIFDQHQYKSYKSYCLELFFFAKPSALGLGAKEPWNRQRHKQLGVDNSCGVAQKFNVEWQKTTRSFFFFKRQTLTSTYIHAQPPLLTHSRVLSP